MPITTFTEFTEQFFADAPTMAPIRPPASSPKSAALTYPTERAGATAATRGAGNPSSADPCTFGDVLFVSDRTWGFEAPVQMNYPGVCVHTPACIAALSAHCALFCRGIDAMRVKPRFRASYVMIESSAGNGLTKRTAFSRAPRAIRSHLVRLLYQDRYAGRLDRDDITRLWRKVCWPMPVTTEGHTEDTRP